MSETINRMWENLKEYFSKMPPHTRRRLLILSSAIIVLAIIIVSFLSRTKWVPLPGAANSISPESIAQTLTEIGVPTRQDGLVTQVPEDRAEEAVMYLRDRGLIVDSTLSYDIMSQATGFSVNSAYQKQVFDAMTADWIRTALLQNPRVQNALVQVNSGETSPFRIHNNARAATAWVSLTLNDGGALSQLEAQTIAEMIKGAIPGIEYENISISDNMLRSYKVGDAAQGLEVVLDQRLEFQNRLTEQAKAQIEMLLSPIYGLDNLRVQPYIRLNFDKTSIVDIQFEPPIAGSETGIVRSSEEIYERSRRWAAAEGIPGTDSNGMGTAEYPYGDFGDDDYYLRDVIGLNYEINETRTAIEVAEGKIEEFGISVLINSAYLGEDIDAEPEDYSSEVADLVSKAIGVPKSLISVQHVPFKDISDQLEAWRAAQEELEARQFRNWLIEQILKYGTIILLIIMVFMLVRSILTGAQQVIEPEELLTAEGPPGAIDILIDEAADRQYEDVDLTAKSPGLEQIERFIDKDAAAVTQLLRNWLSED